MRRQKLYKDDKRYVQTHGIKVGDTILLSRKSAKTVTPYDPDEYKAVEIHGTQVTGPRGNEGKTRDSHHWKVTLRSNPDYQ